MNCETGITKFQEHSSSECLQPIQHLQGELGFPFLPRPFGEMSEIRWEGVGSRAGYGGNGKW